MTVIKPLIIISDTKNISIKKVNKMIKKFVKANNVNNIDEDVNISTNEVLLLYLFYLLK